MQILLIDDVREIEMVHTVSCHDQICVARNYQEGICLLKSKFWDVLYLDHDLASFENGIEKTGYDVMCWLEQNLAHVPKKIICVSSNPPGKQKINQVIKVLQDRRVIE